MRLPPSALVMLLLVTLTGCGSSTDVAAPGDDAREQSQGLSGTEVIVHRAYGYDGHSYHKSKPGRKLIAVDVEFRNPGKGLDLDDVKVIDGVTSENCGSIPDIFLLTDTGELAAKKSKWPRPPKPLRVLLVYSVPDSLESVNLSYWEQDLMATAKPVSGTGPSVATPSVTPPKVDPPSIDPPKVDPPKVDP